MDFKRYLPHIAAVGIFLFVLLIFLNPVVFGGKQIRQGDIYNFAGGAKEITDYRAAHNGEEPLWTNSMFGGMPAYQISTRYPGNFIGSIQSGLIGVLSTPVSAFLLTMVGFYFLLVSMKVNPWVSIGGALAFGLASYTIIVLQAGHNTKVFAMAYMAPVLAGILLTMRGRLLLGGAITALSLALELSAGHLQITYYLAILCLLIGIGEVIRLVKEKQFGYLTKAAAMISVAVVLAILPNLTNLYLTNEYGKETTRGRSELTIDTNTENKTEDGLSINYATQWSYGIGESFTLLIPDFYGGASEAIGKYDKAAVKKASPEFRENIANGVGAYFGDQPFTSGPVYVGAIFCFLFVWGMFIVKDSIKWWLLAATVVSIAFSWGSNAPGLTEFLFHNLPAFNKFRAVSMILVVACLTIPLMGMLAIRELMTNPQQVRASMRSFWIALGITGGITFLVAIMPSAFVTTVGEREIGEIQANYQKQGAPQSAAQEMIGEIETVRYSIVSSDALRSFLFILLSGVLLFFYIRKPYPTLILAGGLLVLFSADMLTVGSRYLSAKRGHFEKKSNKMPTFEASASDELILQDKDPSYRVLNLTVNAWSDASTSYFHKSIGGYHGAKLKRIQELYEQAMDADIRDFRTLASKANSDSAYQAALAPQATLNMLNTRYLIASEDGGVIRNSHACGNAWFVTTYKTVANADSEMVAVRNFNPKTTAIVDRRFEAQLNGLQLRADSTASIKLTNYSPKELRYTSSCANEQLAVFSEIYYSDGWNAYIDGKKTDHFRADYVLRAMRVPAGKHIIEFKFEPEFYSKGETIARIGSILLLLLFAGAVGLEIRRSLSQKAVA